MLIGTKKVTNVVLFCEFIYMQVSQAVQDDKEPPVNQDFLVALVEQEQQDVLDQVEILELQDSQGKQEQLGSLAVLVDQAHEVRKSFLIS